MSKKEAAQFNRMLGALRTIAKEYQTPEQLKRSCKNQFGLGYEETLEMAYENIQTLAKESIKYVKPISNPIKISYD